MRTGAKWIAAAAVAAALTAATASAAQAADSTRVFGDDRIATAVAVSQATYSGDNKAYSVYVASAANWPDALAASALAAQNKAPLLLVPADGVLPANVADELKRIKPISIYLLGGERSVSGVVESQLKDIASVLRLDGDDRYETAADAAFIAGDAGKTMYVASGETFADALGGGAAAGRVGGTLVLTQRDNLPDSLSENLSYIKPSKVVVMGGPSVVSDRVLDQLKTRLPGVSVTRTSGDDRYATAAAASKEVYPAKASTVLLASGTNFPDGLAGAAVSGPTNRPLLLTQKECVPASTLTEIERLGATSVVVLGGPGVVSDAAASLTPC